MPAVTFGTRGQANQVRNLPAVSSHLASGDDRRSKTVRLSPGVPENVLARLQDQAASSRAADAAKVGQSGLTEAEKRRLDFSRPGVNVPKARSIKAIARAEGVDDWIAFADFTLTVDENRQILSQASREDRGRRMGRSEEKERALSMASAAGARRQGLPGAKQAALFDRDREAQDFIEEEQGFGTDVWHISFRGDRPSGPDFELLEEVHESRSSRARLVDESLKAPRTRDPIEWANAPDEHDFPGIDTVDADGSEGVPPPLEDPGPMSDPSPAEMPGEMDLPDDRT